MLKFIVKFFNKYKELFAILAILLLGLLLRLYNLESRTSFDADQEWLAYRAKDVLSGDFALLGPITSIGSFSIGPGFIYMWAVFSLFLGSAPIAGAYLSVALGIATILGIYLFVRNFIDKRTAFLIAFLMSVSSPLIFWDQGPWAPSLFYLAQVILLTGAYIVDKNKLGYLIMAFGLVVGFQSHFGILLSLLSLLVYFIFVRPIKPDLKTILLSAIILFVGYLPNLVFDISHNFINFYRFISIFKGDGVEYFVGFGKIINTMSYYISSMIYPNANTVTDGIIIKVIFVLIVVNGLKMLRNIKFRKLSLLLLLTAFVPPLLFYIQQGKFSEYYLMMVVPSLIILLSLLLKEIITKRFILILILVSSIYFNFKMFINKEVKWSLYDKRSIVSYMVEMGGKENYGISITTELGRNFGFRYIFDYYGIKADIPPKKGETKIFSIIIPEGFEGMVGLKDFGGIGLIWQGM